MAEPLILTLSIDPAEIPRAMDAAETFAATAGLDPQVRHDLLLAVDEVLINVINHGFPDDGRDDGVVVVTVRRESDGVALVVEDSGVAFDPLAEAPEPDLDAAVDDRPIGGLGVHLVKALASEAAYERTGERNRLSLVFLPRAVPGEAG